MHEAQFHESTKISFDSSFYQQCGCPHAKYESAGSCAEVHYYGNGATVVNCCTSWRHEQRDAEDNSQ